VVRATSPSKGTAPLLSGGAGQRLRACQLRGILQARVASARFNQWPGHDDGLLGDSASCGRAATPLDSWARRIQQVDCQPGLDALVLRRSTYSIARGSYGLCVLLCWSVRLSWSIGTSMYACSQRHQVADRNGQLVSAELCFCCRAVELPA
jgi:hypothetical protein